METSKILYSKDTLLSELKERIYLNLHRFDDPYYRIEGVFQPADASWPGDKEGRALLAYVSHYKINGTEIPCMKQMLEKMPLYTNRALYFGQPSENVIDEQQLSGHSWLLRGLCEHYNCFKDDFSLSALISVTENLYLPLAGRFESYPIERKNRNGGDVSGSESEIIGSWRLSTDTGCAFMSIDGLSHVYEITADTRVLKLLHEMLDVFSKMDKREMRLQTHCTLTAARGMLRLFEITEDRVLLDSAAEIFDLYVHGGGMSKTYQNLNWWGRPDSWTEPCAIVDSLMLAGELYRFTGKEVYRTLASRIFVNGFASSQRENGGAGTDSLVLRGQPYLYQKMPEAFFCCSMRLAEGLYYAWNNVDMLLPRISGKLEKDDEGRYFDGDVMFGEIESGEFAEYSQNIYTVDGHNLVPLLKYYRIPADKARKLRQRILFD